MGKLSSHHFYIGLFDEILSLPYFLQESSSLDVFKSNYRFTIGWQISDYTPLVPLLLTWFNFNLSMDK